MIVSSATPLPPSNGPATVSYCYTSSARVVPDSWRRHHAAGMGNVVERERNDEIGQGETDSDGDSDSG